MSSIFDIYSIQRELASVEKSLSEVETQIAELKEALKWIDEMHPRAMYKTFAGRVAIELDPTKAREVIEAELEKLEKVKVLLVERRKELLEKLEELQRVHRE
jgi:chaperonin cofactor prefoldin